MEPEDKVNKALTGYERAGIDGEFIEDSCPCSKCNHKWPTGAKCWAFPNGIPDSIMLGDARHDIPRPDLGQKNAIVFEPRDASWPPDMSV